MTNHKHKGYKDFPAFRNMFDKRGQIAILVILAIVIVGGILVFFLFPQATNIFAISEINPGAFLLSCIEPEIDSAISKFGKQGGYSNPSSFITHQDQRVQYLCYTSENYKPCKVQQPLIKENFEKEIERAVLPKTELCVQNLKEEYESQGFEVERGAGLIDLNVRFNPGRIVIEFLSPMTITKESSQTFTKFNANKESEMYDLLMTATSIIQFESTLGDSETSLYLQYYPDLKIEKIRTGEGDTIYTLTNVATQESFTFASRSLIFPPGYGFEEL